MLGQLRFTQNLEIPTGADDILGKGYIFCRVCTFLGISSLFFGFPFSIVSAGCLSYNHGKLFYDITNVSLFPVYELRMPTEYG